MDIASKSLHGIQGLRNQYFTVSPEESSCLCLLVSLWVFIRKPGLMNLQPLEWLLLSVQGKDSKGNKFVLNVLRSNHHKTALEKDMSIGLL
jgi:hypothetical protein